MKKAVVLGMILLALGTLAYAEGATVGFGFGRTTFTVAQGFSGTGAPVDIMQGWGISDWPPSTRQNLDLAWSGDHTAFKVTGYLEGTVISWVNIYGTLKLMPDMFSVMIGRFDGDGFDAFRKTSPHPLRDVNNGNVGRFSGWGIIADVAPKDSGFEAAVMYRTEDPTGAAVDGAPGIAANVASNVNLGASYTVPNLLKVAIGSDKDTLWPAPGRNIFGRVEILMVPNLTLWADVAYSGLDLPSPAPTVIAAELAAGYDMKPLTIAFAGKFTSANNTVTTVNVWEVYPEVYYNLGAFTLGLYAAVSGSDVANSGIGYAVEPYVVLNDFNLRVSFMYAGSTATGAISEWRIPVIINWGF